MKAGIAIFILYGINFKIMIKNKEVMINCLPDQKLHKSKFLCTKNQALVLNKAKSTGEKQGEMQM